MPISAWRRTTSIVASRKRCCVVAGVVVLVVEPSAVELDQVVGARQAARMAGQDPVAAVTHVEPSSHRRSPAASPMDGPILSAQEPEGQWRGAQLPSAGPIRPSPPSTISDAPVV